MIGWEIGFLKLRHLWLKMVFDFVVVRGFRRFDSVFSVRPVVHDLLFVVSIFKKGGSPCALW